MATLFFNKDEGGRRWITAVDNGVKRTDLTSVNFTGVITREDDGAHYPVAVQESAETPDQFYYDWPTAWAQQPGWYGVQVEVDKPAPGKFQAVLQDQVYVSAKLWDDISISGTATVQIDASAIADEVWDRQLSQHQLVGSAGKKLSDLSSAASVDPTAIADAVWDELRIDHTAVGSFGERVNIDTDAVRLAILGEVVNGNIHGFTVAETLDLVRKIAANKLELAEGSVDNLILFDDNGVDPLIIWDQKDKVAAAIEIPLKGPARRGLPDYTGV